MCVWQRQVYEGMVQQLEVSPVALQQRQQALAANPAAVLPPLEPAGGPIADLPSDQAALVWIQYMRFSRRSESVTASRKVRWLYSFAKGACAAPLQSSSTCYCVGNSGRRMSWALPLCALSV